MKKKLIINKLFLLTLIQGMDNLQVEETAKTNNVQKKSNKKRKFNNLYINVELAEENISKQPYLSAQYNSLKGILNTNNNCYMNAVLQCLMQNTDLVENLSSDQNRNNPLLLLFKQLIKDKIDPQISYLNICDLYNFMISKYFNNNISSQEDAHEFLICLLNELAYNACGFLGLESSQIICKNCMKTKKTIHPFITLSLSIENNFFADTVENLLNNYFQSEHIEPDLFNCPNCFGINFEKQLRIVYPPEFLILHIKRFSYDIQTQMLNKINTLLDIKDYLILPNEFFDKQSNHCIYTLESAVEHYNANDMQGINAGHYISLVKQNNIWYECNDTQVYSIENITDYKSTYILFYKKLRIQNIPENNISSSNNADHAIENQNSTDISVTKSKKLTRQKPKRSYKCDFINKDGKKCKKVCRNQRQLYDHKRTHPKPGESYICNFIKQDGTRCEQICSNPLQFYDHKRRHRK